MLAEVRCEGCHIYFIGGTLWYIPKTGKYKCYCPTCEKKYVNEIFYLK